MPAFSVLAGGSASPAALSFAALLDTGWCYGIPASFIGPLLACRRPASAGATAQHENTSAGARAAHLQTSVMAVTAGCDNFNGVCRPDWVIDQTFDLFVDLGATDEQCDFPVVYASGVNGIAGEAPEDMSETLEPLFEAVVNEARRFLPFWPFLGGLASGVGGRRANSRRTLLAALLLSGSPGRLGRHESKPQHGPCPWEMCQVHARQRLWGQPGELQAQLTQAAAAARACAWRDNRAGRESG